MKLIIYILGCIVAYVLFTIDFICCSSRDVQGVFNLLFGSTFLIYYLEVY